MTHVKRTDTFGGGTCHLFGVDHSHGPGSSCCRTCGLAWTGYNRCHCRSCHNTFGGVGGFDDHRRDGRCRDMAASGLHHNGQYWVGAVGDDAFAGVDG